MTKKPFHVKKHTLLVIAGFVWIIAGFNISRLGITAYCGLEEIKPYLYILSAVVFAAFGTMFYKMTLKHSKRIRGYRESFRPVWHFFTIKAYCIMAVMMGGGIWLRYSGLVPDVFIAVFYTGLGIALGLSGVLFLLIFFRYRGDEEDEE